MHNVDEGGGCSFIIFPSDTLKGIKGPERWQIAQRSCGNPLAAIKSFVPVKPSPETLDVQQRLIRCSTALLYHLYPGVPFCRP